MFLYCLSRFHGAPHLELDSGIILACEPARARINVGPLYPEVGARLWAICGENKNTMTIHTRKAYWLWWFRLLGLTLLFAGWLLCGKTVAADLYLRGSTQGINVRAGAGPENPPIASLRPGTRVTLLSEEEGWAEVALEDGRKGWVLKRLLSAKPPSSHMTAEKLTTAEKLVEETQRLQERVRDVERSQQELSQEIDRLKTQSDDSSRKPEDVRKAYERLEVSSNFRSLFSGVGLLTLGWVLGYWMGCARRRRSSDLYVNYKGAGRTG